MSLPTKKQVLEIVDKYANGTKQHLLQVGDIMEYFADKLGEDKHYWWIVGVLHDIDRDYIGKNGEKHCKQDLEKIVSELNLPEQLINDIRSHAFGLVPGIMEKPDILVRKYLVSIDELSGFIWAYFRMLPSYNPMDIKPKSIKKKIKDKSFASGVDRNEVKNCETKLDISLEEFIEDIKIALSKGNWNK